MLKRNIVVLTIAAVVLGTGAYAWAQGAPERPTTTTVEPGGATPKADGAAGGARRARRFAGRAVHGDLIVGGKQGFENVTFDKGDVVRHSATSITVKRADGVEVTKAIDGTTRFRGIASAGEIVDGRPALVVSKGDTAVLVAQRSGDATKRPRLRDSGNFRRRGTTVVGGGEQVPAT
jgi:hypothetical protein